MAYKIKSKKAKEKNIWEGVSQSNYMKVLEWVKHNPSKWDKAYLEGESAQKKLIKRIIMEN